MLKTMKISVSVSQSKVVKDQLTEKSMLVMRLSAKTKRSLTYL